VISHCIGHHHDTAAILKGENSQQMALVALGNIYTNILDHGYAGDPFPRVDEVDVLLQHVGLSWTDYGSIGPRVVEEIQKAEIFLKI
jgi:hypothetical protein